MAWYGEPLDTRVRVPDTLPDYIEDDAIEKLKAAISASRTKKVVERNILLVELATKTGLRRSELAHLKVGDIDLVRRVLVVRQGKGMKDRVVDLTPTLTTLLAQFIKGKGPEASVFGLRPETISGIVHHFAKKAGLDLHCHSLRHFFGEKLVDAGVDLELVRRLMGHTNLNVTSRYLARTDAQRREAIGRLEGQPAPGLAPLMKIPVSVYNPDKGEWELQTRDVKAG